MLKRLLQSILAIISCVSICESALCLDHQSGLTFESDENGVFQVNIFVYGKGGEVPPNGENAPANSPWSWTSSAYFEPGTKVVDVTQLKSPEYYQYGPGPISLLVHIFNNRYSYKPTKYTVAFSVAKMIESGPHAGHFPCPKDSAELGTFIPDEVEKVINASKVVWKDGKATYHLPLKKLP